MKNTILATLLTFGMIGAANADTLTDSFNYVGVGYTHLNTDFSESYDGATVYGSKTFLNNFYVSGNVNWLENVDAYDANVSVGGFVGFTDNFAAFGEVGYDWSRIQSSASTSNVGVGVKFVPTDKFYLTAKTNRHFYGSGNTFTTYQADVTVNVTDNWAVYGAREWENGQATLYTVGAKFTF